MVKKCWGVKFYALAVSVLAHILALSIFAAVRLAQPKEEAANQTNAAVSISRASVLAERSAVAAKPKVVSSVLPEEKTSLILKSQITNSKQIANLNYRATNEEHNVVVQEDTGKMPATQESAGEAPATEVEFFGSVARGRRICYVVDCSGSMQGLWGQVKEELNESIGQLQPDQYFSVIVFGAGSIKDCGGGRMVRASQRARKEANEFIGAVRPRGATNAPAALEHAIKMRDSSGEGPAVIYFLTDGFELSEQGNSRFEHQVETMLKNFSAKTQINTIGFLCEEQDMILLETIAKKSGGRFTHIRGTGEKQ